MKNLFRKPDSIIHLRVLSRDKLEKNLGKPVSEFKITAVSSHGCHW